MDPSAGTMIFTENYSGNIRTVTQTDANSKTLTIVYDKYGRPKSKVQPEFTTTYKYDPVTNRLIMQLLPMVLLKSILMMNMPD